MNINDKIEIINIGLMWDTEIYFKGYGLDRIDIIEQEEIIENKKYPKFNKKVYFKNGDICRLKSNINYEGYYLEIQITDVFGNSFICESQDFTLDELENFCKVTE